MTPDSQVQFVHYLPLATTVLSAVFCVLLLHRYWTRRTALHLLWWGLGILAYGIGTALESSVTLFGNSVFLTKAWYIAGALLGGYPLAQGTVYLLLKRTTANLLTWISLPFIGVVAVLVVLSPVVPEALEPHRPSGAILGWQWVRMLTPVINLYAVIFLVGGAILSSYRYARKKGLGDGARAFGNALIAFGAILPGIGGAMAKAGAIEALYVGELVGLLFIWAGFTLNIRAARHSISLATGESEIGAATH